MKKTFVDPMLHPCYTDVTPTLHPCYTCYPPRNRCRNSLTKTHTYSHDKLTTLSPRSCDSVVSLSTLSMCFCNIIFINYLIIYYYIYVLIGGGKGSEGVASTIVWWPLLPEFHSMRKWFFFSDLLGISESFFLIHFSFRVFPPGIKSDSLSISLGAKNPLSDLQSNRKWFFLSEIFGALGLGFSGHTLVQESPLVQNLNIITNFERSLLIIHEIYL